ncbi:hypothetical protein Prudu_021573, partial [Prunus dulcis]
PPPRHIFFAGISDGKNFTVRPPFQVPFLAKASSLPPLPSPPLISDRKPGKRQWQRREKPAKTTDVTGDFFCHREVRRRLEQVLQPRIRSRRDPFRVKQRGIACEWTLFSNLMHGFMVGNIMHDGRLCQKFGRESRFLVSGPDIGMMSAKRWGPLRFQGNSGAGLVKIVTFVIMSTTLNRYCTYYALFEFDRIVLELVNGELESRILRINDSRVKLTDRAFESDLTAQSRLNSRDVLSRSCWTYKNVQTENQRLWALRAQLVEFRDWVNRLVKLGNVGKCPFFRGDSGVQGKKGILVIRAQYLPSVGQARGSTRIPKWNLDWVLSFQANKDPLDPFVDRLFGFVLKN